MKFLNFHLEKNCLLRVARISFYRKARYSKQNWIWIFVQRKFLRWSMNLFFSSKISTDSSTSPASNFGQSNLCLTKPCKKRFFLQCFVPTKLHIYLMVRDVVSTCRSLFLIFLIVVFLFALKVFQFKLFNVILSYLHLAQLHIYFLT